MKKVKFDLPEGYTKFLSEIKTRISLTQTQAVLAASRELLALYWGIGNLILEKQKNPSWGTSIIERLAKDLQRTFPGMEGFSTRNIWRMRAFCLAYPAYKKENSSVIKKISFLPQAVAEIPWGHHILLLEKVELQKERDFYAKMAIQHGWSRSMLLIQIESRLFSRQGKATTNFQRVFQSPHSNLAEQSLKDPYVFDFLNLSADMKERALEQGLIDHIQHFLLELGVGFAFVGRQVLLSVGDRDFYLDLLFYHLTLRCFVVIELKTVPFEPEFAGKLNFYLSAVDEKFKRPGDQPTIGLLLCKSKNKFIAEYALREMKQPIGVAAWKVRLVETLPKKMKTSLPTIKQIEEELTEKKRR